MKLLVLTKSLFFATLFITGCKSITSFESPNELRNIQGTLYLKNGKKESGKLVIQTENTLGNPVKVLRNGDKDYMKFKLLEVEGYEVRGEYYALKEVRNQNINIGRTYAFMKQVTMPDSKIQLYENMEKVRVANPATNNTTATSSTRYELNYYLQFPNEQGDAVWGLTTNRFVPNFDEKMSKLVADCPSLAKKIANKEAGYFYAQVTLFGEKRREVLLNIINEYNRCK